MAHHFHGKCTTAKYTEFHKNVEWWKKKKNMKKLKTDERKRKKKCELFSACIHGFLPQTLAQRMRHTHIYTLGHSQAEMQKGMI